MLPELRNSENLDVLLIIGSGRLKLGCILYFVFCNIGYFAARTTVRITIRVWLEMTIEDGEKKQQKERRMAFNIKPDSERTYSKSNRSNGMCESHQPKAMTRHLGIVTLPVYNQRHFRLQLL